MKERVRDLNKKGRREKWGNRGGGGVTQDRTRPHPLLVPAPEAADEEAPLELSAAPAVSGRQSFGSRSAHASGWWHVYARVQNRQPCSSQRTSTALSRLRATSRLYSTQLNRARRRVPRLCRVAVQAASTRRTKLVKCSRNAHGISSS